MTLNVGLMKPRKGFIPVAGVGSRRPIDPIALLKSEEEEVFLVTVRGGKLTDYLSR